MWQCLCFEKHFFEGNVLDSEECALFVKSKRVGSLPNIARIASVWAKYLSITEKVEGKSGTKLYKYFK